jgi:hypothetical protein
MANMVKSDKQEPSAIMMSQSDANDHAMTTFIMPLLRGRLFNCGIN